jgi:hypothetical protein
MTDRTDALAEALAERNGGAGAYPTPDGEVVIERVEIRGDTVDVFLAGATEGGDPHFRIVNPPLLVPDPLGDILTVDGPHRRDPVAAIAYVIASLGGATKPKGRRK